MAPSNTRLDQLMFQLHSLSRRFSPVRTLHPGDILGSEHPAIGIDKKSRACLKLRDKVEAFVLRPRVMMLGVLICKEEVKYKTASRCLNL